MIKNVQQMIDQGWVEDDGSFPPGFFYKTEKGYPHLHVTASFANNKSDPPWNLAYLGYTPYKGGNRIYIYKAPDLNGKGGVDNPSAIDNISEKYQAQATWAYKTLK